MKQKVIPLFIGVMLGAVLFSGNVVNAAIAPVNAVPTWQPIFVDRQQVRMEAYNINGNNYVKLRDIGKAVGFNVYWNDGVQIDSDAPYTGEKPVVANKPTPVDVQIDNEITGNMQIRNEMIQLINEVRRQHGATELTVNQSLMDAAQQCSETMHTSHHVKEECEIVLACGYPHGFSCNLTMFTSSMPEDIADNAVTNWVNSPGHLDTMVNPRADTLGVGVTSNGRAFYCYMIVGLPYAHNPYA